MSLVKRGKKVLSPALGHYTQLEIEKGIGSYLIGKNKKKYLDFACGIAVTNTGHCHPQVVSAAIRQVKKIIHNCAGVTYTDANIEYLEKLQKVVPIKNAHFFLTQSGSEAIEGAIKCAKQVTKKQEILVLKGGFHGRTYAALSATSSNPKYKEGYGKMVPGIKIVPRDLTKIKKAITKNTAAILTELVLGEGGYEANDSHFIRQLRKLCTQKKVLLMIDEVQTGFGRTGKLFASDWYNLIPDIMTLAKGIASGFPLGVIVIKPELSKKWPTSSHGGTYTGNLVACAAASATLAVIKKEIPKMKTKIKILDDQLQKILKKYPNVFSKISGLGYMKAIHLKNKQIAKPFLDLALKNQLLLITTGKDGDGIRIVPPVTISTNDLTKGLKILDKVAGELLTP